MKWRVHEVLFRKRLIERIEALRSRIGALVYKARPELPFDCRKNLRRQQRIAPLLRWHVSRHSDAPQQADATPSALCVLQSADTGSAYRHQRRAQGVSAAMLRLELDFRAHMQNRVSVRDEVLPPLSRREVWYERDAVSVLDELIDPIQNPVPQAEMRVHPDAAVPGLPQPIVMLGIVLFGGNPRHDLAARVGDIDVERDVHH